MSNVPRKSTRWLPALAGVATLTLLLFVAVAPAEAAATVDWSMASVQPPRGRSSRHLFRSVVFRGLSTTDCLASGYDELPQSQPGGNGYPQKAPSFLYHPLLWRWGARAGAS